MNRMRIGELLIEGGYVAADQVDEALRKQQGQRLGSTLISLGHVDADVVALALGKQKGVSPARGKHFEQIDAATLEIIPVHLIERYRVVPLGIATRAEPELVIAMLDPDDAAAVDELAFAANMAVRPAAAPQHYLDHYLAKHYNIAPRKPAPRHDADIELELAEVPHKAPAPAAAATMPAPLAPRAVATTEATPPPTGLLPSFIQPWMVIVGLVAVGSMVFYWKKCGSEKEAPVAGLYFCEHVGLWIDFPEAAGWRYVPKEDQSATMGDVTIKGAAFYAGGTVDSPELGLLLFSLDSKGAIPDDMDEAEFEKLFLGATRNMSYRGGAALKTSNCEVTMARERMAGQCGGEITHNGEQRYLTVFFWIEGGGIVVLAAFLSVEPGAEIRHTIDEMMNSVAPA